MSTLASVKSFDALLEYLEHELDWPIDELEIDDLTFDYDPEEELGLDPKTAAKIRHIKQLRPLRDGQPFGIFFIEFEPKRLPVTVLRRILGRLVTKKRSSANPADRQTWHQDDLIFASVYGDNEHRRIDFAHFADDAENGLATLRVLGWDDDDTDRKLEWVEGRLRSNLAWPSKENSTEWRTRWRDAFILRHREAITTSKRLAEELAYLAQRIRKRVLSAINAESKTKGQLRKLHKAFQDSLIHDLDEARFADTYAQTIAYGLLSARMSRPSGITADDAALMIPNTNPFLRELMEEFLRVGGRGKSGTSARTAIDFDELGVNDVVELLRSVNVEAVIADFGRERPGEDPVIHFYEYFMTVYDKKEKIKRGVFYTPKPVVSFIVRSVDEILREEFGLPLGLADTTTWGEMAARHRQPDREGGLSASEFRIPEGVSPNEHFVQILDPATGTGTFLVETIDLIHKRMVEHWKAQKKSEAQITELWNQYVPEHLLPRLYGFELMMAPYAIAHMKIGLKLADTKYRFQSEQRLRVFLTNSLEPPTDLSEMLEFVAPFLAHEARAAANTKRHLASTVIVGNPPYSNLSANLRPAARSLVARLKLIDGVPIIERNRLQLERNINDDYVKFLVLCENLVAKQGLSVIGLITNRSYLNARTLRGLRASLLQSFDHLRIVDLGGATGSPSSPAELRDDNVFDIEQPVGVALLSRSRRSDARTERVSYRRVRGDLDQKFLWLDANTSSSDVFALLTPTLEQFLLAPFEQGDGWSAFLPLDACLVVYAEGLKTGCDGALVGFDAEVLATQLHDLADSTLSADVLRQRFSIGEKGWGTRLMMDRARTVRLIANAPAPTRFAYRPLDLRWTIWGSNLLKASSRVAGRHLYERADNLALLAARQVDGPEQVTHFLVTRSVPDNRVFYSKKGSATYFPLWSADGGSNFSEDASAAFERALSRSWIDDKSHDSADDVLGPTSTLHYSYAIFHSPEYRERFEDPLKGNFPSIPVPLTWSLYTQLAILGADLVALHLVESDYRFASWERSHGIAESPFGAPRCSFSVANDREVRLRASTLELAPSLKGPGFGRVYINDTAYFDGVPEAVWKFQIGGYQVCHKWLSDRKGRTLTDEDIAHYHKIIIALSETIRIMGEIDKVIEAHGGWPGAFVTDPAELEKLGIKPSATSAPSDADPPDEPAENGVPPTKLRSKAKLKASGPKDGTSKGGDAAGLPFQPAPASESAGAVQTVKPAPPAWSLKAEPPTTAKLFDAAKSKGKDEHPGDPDYVQIETLVATVRTVFTGLGARDGLPREAALRAIADELGYERLGSRVRTAAEDALATASRRRIVVTVKGEDGESILVLATRSIDDYTRDECVQYLIAAMRASSAAWDRDDAIAAAARHLGFRRTGAAIREAFKSAINAAIRRGLLEKDGQKVRISKT